MVQRWNRFLPPTLRRPVPLAVVATVVGACLLLGWWGPHPGPATVEPRQVWVAAVEEGARHGLEPRLIYAIAMAESSLDPRASTRVARGLMQLTRGAWGEVSAEPYREAWHWRKSIAAGAAYLARLRAELAKRGQHSTAVLAAAYYYGLGGVAARGYDASRFAAGGNRIYAALFRGEAPPLVLPPP